MPIVLPQGLPAAAALRAEGVSVLEAPRSRWGDVRVAGTAPLRVVLLNLMPAKAATERQIARLLGGAGLPVTLTLALPDGYSPRHADPAHIESFYRRWGEIRHRAFDGLIVTGAPVETLPFEDVAYWAELTRILDWAHGAVGRTLAICWGAQAALRHRHRVDKRPLPEKAFGVYRQRLRPPASPVLAGFGATFPVPVSRHTEVVRADLPLGRGLSVLAESAETGLCLIEDRPYRSLYMFNHLEYDADTLEREYRRDRAAGRQIAPPRHYFPGDDPAQAPVNAWRGHARRFFANWLCGMTCATSRHAA